MSDLFFSTNITNDKMLCISPLTDRKAEAAGEELGEPMGYFLYEFTVSEGQDSVSVIAKLLSEDAAWRLSRLMGME